MRFERSQATRCLAVGFIVILGATSRGVAQQVDYVGGRTEFFAGSDLERYLRYLQTDGRVVSYPWSIRAFSPLEVDSLVPRGKLHPWAARYDFEPRTSSSALRFDYVRPEASVRFNSAMPYGSNDGPIWAGRGVTTAFQAGVAFRWRALALKLAPIAFRAENTPFALLANGETGSLKFGDRQFPFRVDRPQRFGDTPYAMLDPGESFLRLDTHTLSLGVSTATQEWGPAETYPLILGNNAAGFPHFFAGTGLPANLWLARVHARLVYGELSQSSYSSMRPDSAGARRFMSGFVLSLQPRGISGLEVGLERFFHSAWPRSGIRWSDLRAPVEPYYKSTLVASAGSDDVRNQLAALFFRWVLPHSAFELYGEFGKEDHNWNLRDLTLEPDHASMYEFGFRKQWSLTRGRMFGLRGEFIEHRLNTLTRDRDMGAGYFVHGDLRQGHTERGQLLAADVTGGSGAGTTLALDSYGPEGRWTVSWTRTLIDEYSNFFSTGIQPLHVPEVQHALGLDLLMFRGPIDLRIGTTAVYVFNRYFDRDQFNVNLLVGGRRSW